MKELVVSEKVFAYLKPTIVFMKYLGLAPLTYSSKNGSYTLRKSTTYILYSFIIAVVLAAWAFYGLWMDSTSEYSFRVKNKNDVYVTLADIGGVILSVFTGIILGPLKIEALFDIIRSFNNMNNLLNENTPTLKWDRFYSLIFIFTVYVISTSILILDLYAWSERTTTAQLSVAYLKNYFSFYLFYVVLISQQLAYNNLSFHLKRRVMALNFILMKEIMRTTEEKGKDYIFWIKIGEKEILESFLRRNEVFSLYSRTSNRNIKVFRNVYDEIENCIQGINQFFDYPLMFNLITCFIHLIITIWGILVQYYTRWLFFFMNIVWIIIQTGRLLFVIEPIHKCLVEMSKTKPLVAKLVAEVHDRKLHRQLIVLVERIKASNPLFTACGIVSIRRPLLSTIAGAVTTYLVILYQLHNATRVD